MMLPVNVAAGKASSVTLAGWPMWSFAQTSSGTEIVTQTCFMNCTARIGWRRWRSRRGRRSGR